MNLVRALTVAALTICCASPAPQPFVGKLPPYGGGHFAIIGDTQRTTIWGKALLNETNDPERELLLPMLASRKPAFVVMLGDLVSFGTSDDDWSEFEAHAKNIREGHIPVLAVLGNHEHLLRSKSGVRHFFDRLPDLKSERWYQRAHGPLGMLFLDSNVDELTDQERGAQLAWYRDALTKMHDNANVQGILVFMHHPPYTNNSRVGDDEYAKQAFVPPFVAAGKTMVFITGHAHGYERFEMGTKMFVVSAGGGGPRFPILTGEKRRHQDEKYGVPGRRHFNFVELSFRPDGLHAEVVGLPKDSKTFCLMDDFDLKWPVSTANRAVVPADGQANSGSLPRCDTGQLE